MAMGELSSLQFGVRLGGNLALTDFHSDDPSKLAAFRYTTAL